MKNAILIHGTSDKEEYYDTKYPTASNSHWFPWLTKELVVRDIPTVAVEMPDSYMPDYELWKKEFERFDITPETILVGHSCGGGFIVRYLSENPDIKVGKVVLVAPWLDPNNKKQNNFFDFEIDNKLTSRTKGLTIFNSTNDSDGVNKSIAILQESLSDFEYKEFIDYGHFCLSDLGTEAFPELLKEIVG